MQNLFIDIGNSYIKAAEKMDGKWSVVFKDKLEEESNLYAWLDKKAGRNIVVSSVVSRISERLNSRYPGFTISILTYRDIPAELIQYKTPETLGMDRFLSCYGAANQVEGGVVVIDAGSACTIDYITADHIYLGGVIMPGLRSLIRSISKDLPALPGPDTKLPADWPGRTSMDCVRWGTTGVFIEAIRGFLHRYKRSYGEFTLFVTGGDVPVLEKNLGDDIKIVKRPFLIFEGMEAFVENYGAG